MPHDTPSAPSDILASEEEHLETTPANDPDRVKLSRRHLLKIGGVAATAGAVPAAGMLLAERDTAEAAPAKAKPTVGPSPVPVTLKINGKSETLPLEPRVTL